MLTVTLLIYVLFVYICITFLLLHAQSFEIGIQYSENKRTAAKFECPKQAYLYRLPFHCQEGLYTCLDKHKSRYINRYDVVFFIKVQL